MARLASIVSSVVLLLAAAPAALRADEGANAAEGAASGAQFVVGGDIYLGLTNLFGPTRGVFDGIWAGYSLGYPSVVYGKWTVGEDQEAKVSWGIGDMLVGSDRTRWQPVEAYYRRTLGEGKLTVGKFWVPCALQEWQYETKWGVGYEAPAAVGTVSASLNYDENRKTGNAYLRAGRQVSPTTTIGLSAAAGQGFSYGSSHGIGGALDVTHTIGKWTIISEYFRAQAKSGQFEFAFAKVTAPSIGCLQPWAGAYWGRDDSDELGSYDAATVGCLCKVNSVFSVEPSYARASGRNVWWIQSHLTF